MYELQRSGAAARVSGTLLARKSVVFCEQRVRIAAYDVFVFFPTSLAEVSTGSRDGACVYELCCMTRPPPVLNVGCAFLSMMPIPLERNVFFAPTNVTAVGEKHKHVSFFAAHCFVCIFAVENVFCL